jgi:hypothetical protein
MLRRVQVVEVSPPVASANSTSQGATESDSTMHNYLRPQSRDLEPLPPRLGRRKQERRSVRADRLGSRLAFFHILEGIGLENQIKDLTVGPGMPVFLLV